MKISKVKKTYNDYDVSLSFGQLEAIRKALESSHNDPLSDELLCEIVWYLDRVPGPGAEDESELKADAKAGGKEGAVEGEDIPIPMPPGSEAGTPPGEEEPTSRPPAPGEEDAGGEPGAPAGGDGHGLPEPGMDADPLTAAAAAHRSPRAEREPREPAARREPAADRAETDHRLPPPPRE